MSAVKKFLKNKIFIISSISLSILIIAFVSFSFIVKSSFKLNGESEIFINYNEQYKEEGATTFNKQLNKKIKIKSNIIEGEVGTYEVEYNFKFFFLNLKKVRIIHVVDNDLPAINLKGETSVTICPNKEYQEEGFEAIDEYDGDLTDKVIISTLDNEIIYEVEDSSGNTTKAVRNIVKEDSIKPTITLNGSSAVYVRNGAKYYENGVTITDNCDENIKVSISGSVDTSKDGTYTLTYLAVDSAGNKSTAQRKVIVYTDNRVGIVYLTFDDGPSGTGSTEKILNVLKNEGVKATFFVTGYGPDSLIKRAYDEGHAIGIHTYSHDYKTIYSSVNNFYNDLNKIKSRIKNIIGLEPTITRFPGGSNNTVSNNYSYGIMNTLTKDVVSKGYSYFDWNVAANDAGGCYDSACVYRSVTNNLSKDRVNIVLMHDSKMHTANALSDIIRYCKENGFVFEVIKDSTIPVRFK